MDPIQELIAKFYETQDEAIYHEAAAAIGREQTLWAAFCSTSRNYYVSPENGEHCAYVFTQEGYFTEFQDYMQKQGILLDCIKNPPEQRTALLADLQRSGIGMVLVNSGHSHLGIRLYDIIRKPDEKAPHTSPVFVRTANYFYQSLHAGKPDRNAQINMFRELYETKFLMPVDPSQLPEENGKRVLKPGTRIGLPVILDQEKKQSFYPFFTDYHELRRFDPQKKFRPILAGYKELCNYSRAASGIVINPMGINLRMDTELLDAVEQVVDGSIVKDAPQKQSVSVKITEPTALPDAMRDAITGAVKDNKQVNAVYVKLLAKSETVRPSYLIVVDADGACDDIYDAIAKAALVHADGHDFEFTTAAEAFGKKAIANSKPLYKRSRFGLFR